jgi:hypothetical protein
MKLKKKEEQNEKNEEEEGGETKVDEDDVVEEEGGREDNKTHKVNVGYITIQTLTWDLKERLYERCPRTKSGVGILRCILCFTRCIKGAHIG